DAGTALSPSLALRWGSGSRRRRASPHGCRSRSWGRVGPAVSPVAAGL
ncbi:MAG: hypothetical protein AVDCRST_MAG49-4651, partial [uncultured Thermomicrobiales bacterium]